MARRNFFLSCFIALLIASFYFTYFQKKEPLNKENSPGKLLQNFTYEEKRTLSDIVKPLFYTSTFGYTLFGDKPISMLHDSGRISDGSDLSFFQRHLLCWAKSSEKKLNAPNFAVVVDTGSVYSFIYLVNKKAFLQKVQKNIAIFRAVLGDGVTPEWLLQAVLSENCGFERALKGNHTLFGILFGFGTKNSLCFDRRFMLEPSWSRQGFPPWKGPDSQEETPRAACVLSKLLQRMATKGLSVTTAPEKIILSSGFRTIQEELSESDRKLVSLTDSPFCISSSVDLPAFAGDPESEETKELLGKYRSQRDLLMKILADDNFIERVLEKFYSSEDN
jgi:hypothetical protein